MSDWSRTALIIGIVVILLTATLELIAPNKIKEGFETMLVPVTEKGYFSKFIPRRGDIGPGSEEGAYITDKRYFNGYSDVQRVGVAHDWCRMVVSKNDPKDMFFACALAGTENLNSLSFRTGLDTFSRDDYMRDTTGSGRADYCRILKMDSETFATQCSIAGDFKFGIVMQQDTAPPPAIETLLSFYDGVLFWFRWRDDMLDYAQNVDVYKAGGLTIDEMNPGEETRTLIFNGIDQYLRIGDNKALEFGDKILLRSMRAICFWVYFEEFTNNAHIIDFGNGAGVDNVVIGILGKGNPLISGGAGLRPVGCVDSAQSTLPDGPSGAQRVVETTPQRLLVTSAANIEEFDCPGPAVAPRDFPKSGGGGIAPPGVATVADLYYEIWDSKQRKMRIVVKGVVPLKKWVHVAITAASNDAFRPDINVWINGIKTYTQPSGWLPQNSSTAKNYIGKSNWTDNVTQYEGRDELFKGRLFDLRAYKSIMGEKKIVDTVSWGKRLLGL